MEFIFMNAEPVTPEPIDDEMIVEVAATLKLFKQLVLLGNVNSAGVQVVRMAAEDLLLGLDEINAD